MRAIPRLERPSGRPIRRDAAGPPASGDPDAHERVGRDRSEQQREGDREAVQADRARRGPFDRDRTGEPAAWRRNRAPSATAAARYTTAIWATTKKTG